MLENAGLAEIAMRELGISDRQKKCDLSEWNEMLDRIKNSTGEVTVSLVGKYVKLHDSYLSIAEALRHAGWENGVRVNINWIDSESLTRVTAPKLLAGTDGILVPGGFGIRGTEGMIAAAEYARTNRVPYFGICLGMQIAAIEFARNVLGYEDANSSEFDPESSHPVIALMEESRWDRSRRAELCGWEPIHAGLRLEQKWSMPICRKKSAKDTATVMSLIIATAASIRQKEPCFQASLRTGTWWRPWRCRAIRFMWEYSTILNLKAVPTGHTRCFANL